ncbi:MAG: GNAT family N-acetyltransferase [Phycisphaerales bacterium]
MSASPEVPITIHHVGDDPDADEAILELIEGDGYEDTGIAAPRIYARPDFHRLVGRMAGGELRRIFAAADGAIVGSLTWLERELDAAIVGDGPRRLLNALPWFGSHGGPLIGPGIPEEPAWEAAHALVAEFRAASQAEDVLATTLISSPNDDPEFVDLLVDAFEPTEIDWRRSQITPLPVSANDSPERIGERLLMDTFGQKTRNLVRKGLKEGFTIRQRDDDAAWHALETLHAAGMTAIGGPVKPPAHFAALRESHRMAQRLWVAEDGGQIVAALLLLWAGGHVEYLVPAVDADHRSRQPMAAIIYSAMVEAVAGHDIDWSWGGTPMGHDSLHRFKAGFGGEDAPYAIMCRPGPAGVDRLRAIGPARLGQAAPWWYAYPFAALGGDAGDANDDAGDATSDEADGRTRHGREPS